MIWWVMGLQCAACCCRDGAVMLHQDWQREGSLVSDEHPKFWLPRSFEIEKVPNIRLAHLSVSFPHTVSLTTTLVVVLLLLFSLPAPLGTPSSQLAVRILTIHRCLPTARIGAAGGPLTHEKRLDSYD